ncbi:MAG: LysR family transcriptional regulator [Eubacteriales bacterium]|nr:LysR family transcriptional regulator [Eubacteriales bacterium]
MKNDIKKVQNKDQGKKIKEYNFSKKLTPLIRLTLKRNEKFYGPGIVELLKLIEKNGSIQKAAKEMEMSYSKAWNIIKRVERELEEKVVETRSGGSGGGETNLTQFGKDFMEKYSNCLEEIMQFTKKSFEKYF